MSLLGTTRELLRNRPKTLTLRSISEQTELSERWLESVNQGKVKEPSVIKIEKLYNFLAKEPLKYDQFRCDTPRINSQKSMGCMEIRKD